MDLFAAYREAAARGEGGFERTLGYQARIDGDRVAIHLLVDARHLVGQGVAHSGVALTLLDTAGGLQAWIEARPRAMGTINLSAQLIEPVSEGPIVATARIDRLGRAVAQASMALHGNVPGAPLLATAVASYRLFRAGAAGER